MGLSHIGMLLLCTCVIPGAGTPPGVPWLLPPSCWCPQTEPGVPKPSLVPIQPQVVLSPCRLPSVSSQARGIKRSEDRQRA